MILPVTVYGNPILRKIAKPIDKDYEGLNELIENMYETMYQADGVGLAAPQIGLSIRLFVIDASPIAEEEPELKDFKKVFINAQITERSGTPWDMEEGCLSLPKINEKVSREEQVTITYRDENWNEKTETYNGYAARVIMHEYDHIDGKLFIDHVSPLRRKLLRSKLNAIAKGKINTTYRIKYPH
ncbi:MAG: peptide deformylase [Prolixibacteraceae bacterium]|jgi:peptide deformylase|nr:peptide deformylase [Prolixibacteraceae bacterium]